MKSDIRKISIGKNFPDGAMHYQVGKTINLQKVPYTIASIHLNDFMLEKGKICFDIFIQNEEGTVLWKSVIDMPVVVENNIDFD